MVQYSNLDWKLKRKLDDAYEVRHPKPTQPVYSDPVVEASEVVRAANNRIFSEISDRQKDNGHAVYEATGQLRAVMGDKNYSITLTEEELGQLADQILKTYEDVKRVNGRRRAHNLDLKQAQEAGQKWEEERELALTRLMKSGKITSDMVADPDQLAAFSF